MRDAAIVRELQRRATRLEDRHDARRRHRRLEIDLLAQAGAAQQLHHHVRLVAAVEAEVEQADDVGMAQLGAGAAFAEEAIARFRRRVRRRLHHLDGDIVAEMDAAGAIDVAHAAGAEGIDDLVAIRRFASPAKARLIAYTRTRARGGDYGRAPVINGERGVAGRLA